MKAFNYILLSFLFGSLLLTSCKKNNLSQGVVDDNFYLRNRNADMPVYVQGNADSKTFVVILHGGPGSTSMNFLYKIPAFTNPMEEDYAMVYWEQRASGLSTGNSSDEDLTLDVFSEDLDKLLSVLEHTYGEDIEFFLIGQSFGGMLGSHYVSHYGANNHKVKGWISSGGVHNFNTYHKAVKSYAQSFLDATTVAGFEAFENEVNEIDTSVSVLEEKMRANQMAAKLQSKTIELELANKRQVEGITNPMLFGNFNYFLSVINKSHTNELMFRHINDIDLTPNLATANVPVLFLAGEYDFVVPPTISQEAFDSYGTSDKQIEVLLKGTHNLYATNSEEALTLIKTFIEQH